MFYSHEILTSRKYGVATVWLVATLGSKSALKKVNRKAILEVNVPKTCETIITPEAPMALRLQGSLLYGVSRVYSQQCGYVLSDSQNAQNSMRALLKLIRTSDLDPYAGKARPDQLILEDDPAFLADFFFPGLDVDLSALDISTDEPSRRSSILSPYSQQSSLSSSKEDEKSMLGLIIPTSDTGGDGEIGGFVLPGDDGGSAQRNFNSGGIFEDGGEGLYEDAGFEFGPDGNIMFTEIETPVQRQNVLGAGGIRIGSDSIVGGRARQEHEEDLQAGQLELGGAVDLDLDLPRFDDEANVLPEAEPFPEMMVQETAQPGFLRSSSELQHEESSSESAEAPLTRKRRAKKVLTIDATQELRNADLAHWNNNYVENMIDAAQAKFQHKAPTMARKNASYWVLGTGIGGVGSGLGSSKIRSPLDMFAGESLLEALTGIETSAAGKKRSRSDEDDEHDSDERRVRSKDDDGDQIGRGDDLNLEDDAAIGPPVDDSIEIGRDAQQVLQDYSSNMPWNTGSRQGSVGQGRGLASSIGGFPSSVGAPGSILPVGGAIPGSLDRRASRITSASPLLGRGSQRLGSLELPVYEDDDELLGGRIVSGSEVLDDFQLYGAAANVDTQTAAQSQWMKATLDQESNNFLDFVKTEIAAKVGPLDAEGDELSVEDDARRSVLFEELLPPMQHTKIVAAQALHHVLALVTKGLMTVQQDAGYGPIRMALADGV